jgi:uncharacterized alpha-E superfamily protein
MTRYVERAENVARFIDANLNMVLDLPMGSFDQWEPLVITTGDHQLFLERYGTATKDNVIQFLAFDAEYPNSIKSCLRLAREDVRSIREFISSEMWEQINKFYLMVNTEDSVNCALEEPHAFFADIMIASYLFAGITDATMSHGEGWHFCRLGCMLERADKTSRILDVKYFILLPSVSYVGTPFDNIQWSALLRSTSAFEMYFKRHGHISPDRIVDFLVLDREFPRSIHHCVIEAEESLRAISNTPTGMFQNPAEQRLGQLRAELDYTHAREIITGGLHEFLNGLQIKLNLIGDAIFETFFALQPFDRISHYK